MALKSDLLLMTGPFALNSCLVRRVSQNYVIATKTRVDLRKVNIPKHIIDGHFRRACKKTSHIEKDIFKRNVPSEQRKADQKNVDEEVLKAIKVHPDARGIRRYLRRCFPCHRHVQPQFQLLTTSIMICPKHSLEQCSINGNGAIRAESHLHLHLRVQVLARAHDSPASGPGRGIPAATQAKGHLREVINNEELPRRIYQKDENYYFLTVDSEQTIDAGPKGNLARFINYSSPTARRCCGRSAEDNP
ncbi:set domain protein [Culex quinquefasciatus]|uniref:Set domain protein n=1 Tax=Culex quinquefasciatus TaxID=7176 RepID=B0X9H9_CULQU|nr:set domain protein [Culex quinquefasciatus]|eukprot:XP_001866301.1 set domain protein [Culex quinquefasciatus]